MSLTETQVAERIAKSGGAMAPQAGWESAVFRAIRDEERPVQLRLVPSDAGRKQPRQHSIFFAGFTLAAAVLAFLLVLEQQPDDRITKRTAAIAMVVEFVELETEMAKALAEIDVTEARMDEAFLELQVSLASHTRPALPSVKLEVPRRMQRHDNEGVLPNTERNAKRKKSSAASICADGGDVACGL